MKELGFWFKLFAMGITSFVSGLGLQYEIYPIATTFGILSIGTLAFIIKEEE